MNLATGEILVVDTSSLISHPEIIDTVYDCNIWIPIEVLEELDNLKTYKDNTGVSARFINRKLDNLRQTGSLFKGVKIPNNSKLYVISDSDLSLIPNTLRDCIDNRIIAVAKKASTIFDEVTLISEDIALRVKCDSLNVESASALEYMNIKETKSDDAFYGYQMLDVSHDIVDTFYAEGELDPKEHDFDEKYYPHEFVILKSEQSSAMARVWPDGIWRKLSYTINQKKGKSSSGVKPRNREQTLALELLLDPAVSMVTLTGMAGSGKTLLAIAAAFQEKSAGNYDKILLTRPAESTSKEIGFLPGPQPLSAKVLTPAGWTTMGKINPGDSVISRDGKPSRVLKIFPQGIKDVYKIKTSDGRETECCEDHLWFTQTLLDIKNNKSGSVKTTKEIMESIRNYKFKNRLNHFLPRVLPVEFDAKEHKIKPYTLGALLGDGSFGNSITLHNTDVELIDRVRREIDLFGCDLIFSGNIDYNVRSNVNIKKTAKRVKITNIDNGTIKIYDSVGIAEKDICINKTTIGSRCKKGLIINNEKFEFINSEVRWTNTFKEEIFKLGLLDTRSHNKFIPSDYIYSSSVNDRIDLLRGLMDTDGCVKKTSGEATFYTVSSKLANDIASLVRSLGGNCTLSSKDVRAGGLVGDRRISGNYKSIVCSISLPELINPFYISRKSNYFKSKYIKGIEIESIELSKKEEVKCILIDNPEHLYVTDDFIITHNTKEEKMLPWLQPIMDNLKVLLGTNGQTYINMMIEKGEIEVESLSYVRGRSFNNTYIIVDEAQNINALEAKALITRVGNNSKIVLLGDLEQIDSIKLNETTSGLGQVVDIFKEFEASGHVTMVKGERSKLATFAAKNM